MQRNPIPLLTLFHQNYILLIIEHGRLFKLRLHFPDILIHHPYTVKSFSFHPFPINRLKYWLYFHYSLTPPHHNPFLLLMLLMLFLPLEILHVLFSSNFVVNFLFQDKYAILHFPYVFVFYPLLSVQFNLADVAPEEFSCIGSMPALDSQNRGKDHLLKKWLLFTKLGVFDTTWSHDSLQISLDFVLWFFHKGKDFFSVSDLCIQWLEVSLFFVCILMPVKVYGNPSFFN